MKGRFYFSVLIYSFIAVGLASCSDDNESNPQPSTQLTDAQKANQTINDWIFDVMDEVYLWTDLIPDGVDKTQDPSDYFKALLFSGDRFSIIVPNYNDLINSLNGIELEAGYEFALARSGETDVVAIVTYIKPGSPAAIQKLKRGDIITEVNGQSMNLDNYSDVIRQVNEDHSVLYRRYDEGTAQFVEQSPLQFSVIQYSENPVYLDTVYTIGAQKVGYFVYNFFSNGSQAGYDAQVEQVFQGFKNANITDLVIDLRYNSGGSITSATNLASHIAPGVTSNDVFYHNQWNDLYQNFWENSDDGDAQLTGYFTPEAANIGNEIGANVYFLTGSRTASASELVINGLAPYMDLTIIGTTTIGKNVGSIPIEDTDNPDNEYGLLPIVIRLTNRDGNSQYADGFTPNPDNEINDLTLPMQPLGSLDEALLGRAIELITGTTMSGRIASKTHDSLEEVGSSLDRHLRSNRVIMENLLRQ